MSSEAYPSSIPPIISYLSDLPPPSSDVEEEMTTSTTTSPIKLQRTSNPNNPTIIPSATSPTSTTTTSSSPPHFHHTKTYLALLLAHSRQQLQYFHRPPSSLGRSSVIFDDQDATGGGNAGEGEKEEDGSETAIVSGDEDSTTGGGSSIGGGAGAAGGSVGGGEGNNRLSATNVAAASSQAEQEDDDSRIQQVLALLNNDSVAEEEKPESLKEMLSDILDDSDPRDLDATVLSVLHRHREDLNPSGQTFSLSHPPTPGGINRPSPSRSSSFRRLANPSSLLRRSSGVSGVPSRPISPSPLRPHSPSGLSSLNKESTPSPFNDTFGPIGSGSPARSLTSSPIGSPRYLNASASEFKPGSRGPGTPTSANPSIASGAPAAPPSPTPATWAFAPSPLGTPKFATPASGGVAGSGSYFPSLGAGGSPSTAIPRDPWQNPIGTSLSQQQQQQRNSNSSSFSGLTAASTNSTSSSFSALTANSNSASSESSIEESPDSLPIGSLSLGDGRSPLLKGGLSGDHWEMTPPPPTGGPWGWDAFELETGGSSSNGVEDPMMGGVGTPDFGMSSFAVSGGGMTMTPFDVLCSVFAGSDVTPGELDEALARNGWDVDKTIEWIVDFRGREGRGLGGFAPSAGGTGTAAGVNDGGSSLGLSSMGSGSGSGDEYLGGSVGAGARLNRGFPPLGGALRPSVISRGSFDRSPRSSAPSSPRFTGRPLTPSSSSPSAGYFPPPSSNTPSSGPGGGGVGSSGGPSSRVCRFFLEDKCLRSDCRFSHDIERAVCRFWLRGHCLKANKPEGCDFLHEIPPNLRLKLRERAAAAALLAGGAGGGGGGLDSDGEGSDRGVRDYDEEFPSLSASLSAGRPGSRLNRVSALDPSRSRWSGAVKAGRPTAAFINAGALGGPGGGGGGGRGRGMDQSPARQPQPRPSPRLSLRPPVLLPTLPTGSALSSLYASYRSTFIELGNQRNRCLTRAAEAYRRGDGAGARRWSREAQDFNRQFAIEGREAAGRILTERMRIAKDVVLRGEGRTGHSDELAERTTKGKEAGDGLGVCLGVAAVSSLTVHDAARLTGDERTEVFLDLHGLHADEGVDYLERFLTGLERERFAGLAFVVIGEEKHTGTADPGRGAGKLRLAEAVIHHLDQWRYPWRSQAGVVCIDALTHS